MLETEKIQKITACAFLHHQGKLLVAQRSLDAAFMPGVFEIPGGHVEFGETIEEALAREIKEELGIDIEVGEPFDVFTYVNAKGTKHTIEVVCFTTLRYQDQEIILKSDELCSWKWIKKSEVEKYLSKNPEEKRAALKGFDIISSSN